MGNRLVRSLAFLCSLLLAFPPMWCCMVLDLIPAARADEGDAEEPALAKSPCCCCKTQTTAPSAAPSPPPREREAPPAPCPSDKCCWDRHTTPPPHPQQFHPDHAVVVLLPVADVLSTTVSVPREITLRALPVSPPIHVFDCVWLC
jgi:hypothetical protein